MNHKNMVRNKYDKSLSHFVKYNGKIAFFDAIFNNMKKKKIFMK